MDFADRPWWYKLALILAYLVGSIVISCGALFGYCAWYSSRLENLEVKLVVPSHYVGFIGIKELPYPGGKRANSVTLRVDDTGIVSTDQLEGASLTLSAVDENDKPLPRIFYWSDKHITERGLYDSTMRSASNTDTWIFAVGTRPQVTKAFTAGSEVYGFGNKAIKKK